MKVKIGILGMLAICLAGCQSLAAPSRFALFVPDKTEKVAEGEKKQKNPFKKEKRDIAEIAELQAEKAERAKKPINPALANLDFDSETLNLIEERLAELPAEKHEARLADWRQLSPDMVKQVIHIERLSESANEQKTKPLLAKTKSDEAPRPLSPEVHFLPNTEAGHSGVVAKTSVENNPFAQLAQQSQQSINNVQQTGNVGVPTGSQQPVVQQQTLPQFQNQSAVQNMQMVQSQAVQNQQTAYPPQVQQSQQMQAGLNANNMVGQNPFVQQSVLPTAGGLALQQQQQRLSQFASLPQFSNQTVIPQPMLQAANNPVFPQQPLQQQPSAQLPTNQQASSQNASPDSQPLFLNGDNSAAATQQSNLPDESASGFVRGLTNAPQSLRQFGAMLTRPFGAPGDSSQPNGATQTAAASSGPAEGQPSLVTNKQAMLAQLISLAEGEVSQLSQLQQNSPNNQLTPEQLHDYVQKNVYLRMLYMMSQQDERSLQYIPGIAAADQEFWQQLFWALSNYFDEQSIPNSQSRASQTVSLLQTAAQRLQENATLELRNVNFCRQINSFGDYEKFAQDEFQAGQRVLIYAEVANFKSDLTSDSKYRTLLKTTIEFYRAGDQAKAVATEEIAPKEDLCRNYRRDFFNGYNLNIPSNLTPGQYYMKLRVEDQLGNKIDTETIKFSVL